MICSILVYARALKTSNNLPMLLGLYLYLIGVKRRTISVLARLGVILLYRIVNIQRKELADLRKVPSLLRIYPPYYLGRYQQLILLQKRITYLSRAYRNKVIISQDNFNYNQNVRYQTLRELVKYISATTRKLYISYYMPTGGLYRLILRPKVTLNPYDIYLAASNQDDKILYGCQRYQIIEAIRYTYRKAIKELFTNYNPITIGQIRKQVILIDWLKLLLIKRLPPRKIPYYGLSPIIENEGIISSIYSVINIVFTE